jgi:hypothetical protein
MNKQTKINLIGIFGIMVIIMNACLFLDETSELRVSVSLANILAIGFLTMVLRDSIRLNRKG